MLGRSATDEEVAKKLGIGVKDLNKLLNEVNLSSLVSLEEFLEQNYEIGTINSNVNKEERPEGYIEAAEVKKNVGRCNR